VRTKRLAKKGATLPIAGIKTHGFEHRFPGTLAGIRYNVEEQYCTNGLDIWLSKPDRTDRVDITTLEVQSGGGKSTLADLLHSFLRSEPFTSTYFTWSAPPTQRCCVAMLPQRPSTVLHWRVRDILPQNSVFGARMLPELGEHFHHRRLSELSGGQTARVFLASAFDRIAISRVDIAFLILDEAFEGVDASLGNSLLTSLSEVWNRSPQFPILRVLLITHFAAEEFLKEIPSRRLKLTPLTKTDVEVGQEIVSIQEVVIGEVSS